MKYFVICIIPAILCTIITIMLSFMDNMVMLVGFGIVTVLLWRHYFVFGRNYMG